MRLRLREAEVVIAAGRWILRGLAVVLRVPLGAGDRRTSDGIDAEVRQPHFLAVAVLEVTDFRVERDVVLIGTPDRLRLLRRRAVHRVECVRDRLAAVPRGVVLDLRVPVGRASCHRAGPPGVEVLQFDLQPIRGVEHRDLDPVTRVHEQVSLVVGRVSRKRGVNRVGRGLRLSVLRYECELERLDPDLR